MTVKKRSGLSSEKRVSRVPADKASQKQRGALGSFCGRTPVDSETQLGVLTGSPLISACARYLIWSDSQFHSINAVKWTIEAEPFRATKSVSFAESG
jgi:hypothetical protein